MNPTTLGPTKTTGSLQSKSILLLFVMGVLPIIALTVALAVPTAAFNPTVAMIGAIVCQVLGLAIGYLLLSGLTRQTATINETLGRINQGDFEARADAITNDELGLAAAKLNAMCDNSLNLIQSNDERDKIQNSIEHLISEMKAIAAGDLSIETAVNKDMTGSIAESVNHMTAQLRSLVQRVQAAAQQVTTSSNRIRESSTQMSQTSDLQSGRITEASQQLLQMTGAFQDVAAMTKASVQVAVDARQTASNGLRAVSDTVDGMQRIRSQVQGTSQRVKRLGETSLEVGEIVQLISDIADRTSILALNASIQAATAGEAGKGFAVVATEIESLAERSTDATKQIAKLIRTIQHETSEVTSDMEEATREVVAGSQLAAQAGVTLFEIDSVSNQLVELIQNSSTSALQQADRATQIANSMSQISQSTKESAEKSREATRAIGSLADTVNQLRDSVSQFKIGNALDTSWSQSFSASQPSADASQSSDFQSSDSQPSDFQPSDFQPTISQSTPTPSPPVVPRKKPTATQSTPAPKPTRQSIPPTIIAGRTATAAPERNTPNPKPIQRTKPQLVETPCDQRGAQPTSQSHTQRVAQTDVSNGSATNRRQTSPRDEKSSGGEGVAKTMAVEQRRDEQQSIMGHENSGSPEDIDAMLLRRVQEATKLLNQSEPPENQKNPSQSTDTPPTSDRAPMRTIMLDDEK